jgi:Chitobiase/beta-hexosaminidase C-terminal domain
MKSFNSFQDRCCRVSTQEGVRQAARPGGCRAGLAAVVGTALMLCLAGCDGGSPSMPAATPTFSPGAGPYMSAQTVTISDSTPGATIYYTQDGSVPTRTSTMYSGPINVSKSETLSAIAVAHGYATSPVATATYSLTLPAATPVFSPGAGSYSGPQSVTISDSSQGATIYYTSDGSVPTTSSHTYSGPIAVSTSETLRAMAAGGGYSASPVASATYTIAGGKPIVTLIPPAAGASTLSGYAYNIDTSKIKVVIYVLTNIWYVQPFINTPYTDIAADGSWESYTHPWDSIVVLLVDPAHYSPPATEITNPALDPGVMAWTAYPSGPASINFSGYTWGIKTTGNAPSDQFDPGPNFWSNDPTVVHVAADGLHLKINEIDGEWQCAEVYLPNSLGYGTYTVQIASPLNALDRNTVAAPLFIYASPSQELDNEYSGPNGLIPLPNSAQFVVQPYTVAGNLNRYVQSSTTQFTSQIVWRADHVTFTTWNGWSATPASSDVIHTWTYTGGNIPPVGQERVHINLWLLDGSAPSLGNGDELIIHSFNYQP